MWTSLLLFPGPPPGPPWICIKANGLFNWCITTVRSGFRAKATILSLPAQVPFLWVFYCFNFERFYPELLYFNKSVLFKATNTIFVVSCHAELCCVWHSDTGIVGNQSGVDILQGKYKEFWHPEQQKINQIWTYFLYFSHFRSHFCRKKAERETNV